MRLVKEIIEQCGQKFSCALCTCEIPVGARKILLGGFQMISRPIYLCEKCYSDLKRLL